MTLLLYLQRGKLTSNVEKDLSFDCADITTLTKDPRGRGRPGSKIRCLSSEWKLWVSKPPAQLTFFMVSFTQVFNFDTYLENHQTLTR